MPPMSLRDTFRRLFAPPAEPEPKPSHARRLAELEGRVDDLEGELEKVSRNVRTWLGRVAKREARAAEAALGGTASSEQTELQVEAQPASLANIPKHQLRQLYAAGRIRKIGS